eukprot:2487034-Pleurochrysis_carterae.AAC.2
MPRNRNILVGVVFDWGMQQHGDVGTSCTRNCGMWCLFERLRQLYERKSLRRRTGCRLKRQCALSVTSWRPACREGHMATL